MSDGDTLSQKWLSKRIQLTFESHFCEYDVCDFSVTFRFCSFLANFSRIWFCISSRLVLPIIQEAEHITKKNIVWAEVRTFVRLFGCCSTNGRLQPACRYVLHTVGPIVRNIPHKCSQIVPVEVSETKAAALCGCSRIVVISIPCSAIYLLDIYISQPR